MGNGSSVSKPIVAAGEAVAVGLESRRRAPRPASPDALGRLAQLADHSKASGPPRGEGRVLGVPRARRSVVANPPAPRGRVAATCGAPPRPVPMEAAARADAATPLTAAARTRDHPPSPPSPRARDFICPITHEPGAEPVMAQDGQTYERSALEAWCLRSATSPTTREPPTRARIENRRVRDAISAPTPRHSRPSRAPRSPSGVGPRRARARASRAGAARPSRLSRVTRLRRARPPRSSPASAIARSEREAITGEWTRWLAANPACGASARGSTARAARGGPLGGDGAMGDGGRARVVGADAAGEAPALHRAKAPTARPRSTRSRRRRPRAACDGSRAPLGRFVDALAEARERRDGRADSRGGRGNARARARCPTETCRLARGVGVEARDGSFASFEALLLRADLDVLPRRRAVYEARTTGRGGPSGSIATPECRPRPLTSTPPPAARARHLCDCRPYRRRPPSWLRCSPSPPRASRGGPAGTSRRCPSTPHVPV